ncbi:MAG: alpha/beta fold hydrolase [Psychroserpens sp.]|nr:alpha/beta fold hydrolase [Psychroserpens sp.]
MSVLKKIAITDFRVSETSVQNIQLSYQNFGQALDEAPVVLVIHALTGNSNVTGAQGWWNSLIGPNQCVDTNRYSVLAFNIPGNGYEGEDSKFIENYREFTAHHIARLFSIGLERLNITKLFAIIGGSVGGGIGWELAALKPELSDYLIPIASDWKSTDWVIANCHIQDTILNNSNDPIADARLHAMTLYRTPESFTDKFNRSERAKGYFNVESWLDHHGKTLTNRFQLAAYRMMNQMLRTIDITKGKLSFREATQAITAHIHIVTINSDLLFKSDENWDTFVDLKLFKENVSISEIKSIHGHDAFLIEFDQLNAILEPIFENPNIKTYENVSHHTVRNW